MNAARPTLYVLTIDAAPQVAEAVAAQLFDAGLRGLEEQAGAQGVRLVTYGEDRREIETYAAAARAYLRELAAFDPAAGPAAVEIAERPNDDWSTSWMQYFRQTRIAEGVVVQPSWDDTPAPAGTVRLTIEPKMAFGFGTHATTQLAARCVERFCRAHPGAAALDVGAGTGVLAFVALLSGAARAVGIDIDPVAVDSARENAALNGLHDRVEFSDRPLHAVAGRFELVIANITAPAIIELADDLARLTAPGGRLALTGVLAEAAREVIAHFDERGMPLTRQEEQDEWALLELTHA